jgi:hypothetical protein
VKRYIQPEEIKSSGDPIVKPGWRQRLADAIRPKDEPPQSDASVSAPAAATPPAKGKSKAIPAWMRKYAAAGGNDERVRRVEYGTDEARSTGAMLERMFPRGPRA